MKKIILTFKILVCEQKVKFYDTVCLLCEKIEQFLVQNQSFRR